MVESSMASHVDGCHMGALTELAGGQVAAPPLAEPTVLFTYGTLMSKYRGSKWNHILGKGSPAVVRGALLYAGPDFPAMFSAPSGEVHGEVCRIKAQLNLALATLDAYECVAGGLYQRVEGEALVDGSPMRCWMYLGRLPQLRHWPVALDGRWMGPRR